MENKEIDLLLEHVRNRYFGKYRGVVTDNQDSTHRGRLQVSVPAVLGDLQVWAMPCVPYAGEGVGSYMLPEAGSGVWIEFEGGDPSYPVWTGFFWVEGQLPRDENNTDANPDLKLLRTKQGLLLSLSDGGRSISLSDGNGSNYLKITVQQGQLKLQATTKVIVEAPQIDLVENAGHPLVYGDELLQYLNQLALIFQEHLHVGDMALGIFPVVPEKPAVPFPPPSPTMLSKNVKTG